MVKQASALDQHPLVHSLAQVHRITASHAWNVHGEVILAVNVAPASLGGREVNPKPGPTHRVVTLGAFRAPDTVEVCAEIICTHA